MREGDTQEGWRISQVERLIDLPRRDIQRACYAGKGGAAILSPANTSWGRRFYSTEDLTRLLLVKLYKDQGYSLPEIKEIFEESTVDGTVSQLLDVHESRLHEQLEETELQLNRVRLLKQALNSRGSKSQTRIKQQLRLHIIGAILKRIENDDCLDLPDDSALPDFENLLNDPGIDLAIDLWAGPGAYDAVVEALWGQSTKRTETRNEE